MERKTVSLATIQNVVMDEADEMLNMGFTDSINAILADVPQERNTLLFSATMSPEIARISKKYLRDAKEITIGRKNESTSNVKHVAFCVPVRARDFIPQMYKNPTVTRSEFGEGLFLILCGLFKKTVISDYISMNFVDRIFDAPLLYTGVENLLGVYGYALQIYCDFSGYSDMAIGIALLLGFRFNINFDSPYQSATITEFWRRWHISLSSWLKDYLYISLGGNRKGKIRTYMNLMITMLLGGLWHGASISFILWGALHGIALAAHKFIMGHFSSFKALGCEMKPWRRVLGVLITFHVVCFGWILFRATSMKAVGEMLSQIFTNFHPEVFMQFVSGYKGVFALMVIGYVLHFMPKRSEDVLREIVTRSPLLIQAAILAIAIFIVVQFKSAGVQPFIYFQF